MNEPDGPAVDSAVLEELRTSVEGDTGFVRDLIGAYLADSALQLDAIEAAFGNGDAAALVRPAHTLKSSSSTLGATRLAAMARTLEMAARAESIDGEDARDAASAIRGEWELAAAALRDWSDAAVDR